MCCGWSFLVKIKQQISNKVIFRDKLTVLKVIKVSGLDTRFVE